MQRVVVFACAALALGIVGSPLSAQQQIGSDQPVSQSEQPTPQTSQPPPTEAEPPLPPPPPFPPMPSARPSHRWVDVGGHHSSRTRHHARPRHHHATRVQHRRTQAHHRPAHKARLAHFSHRTVRSCHGMNYRQIMRHPSCRLLMKQELGATAHRHHRARHHHRAATHRSRHHHAMKRRKR
jgi:hypothetical protein